MQRILALIFLLSAAPTIADELSDAVSVCKSHVIPRQSAAPGPTQYNRGWEHCIDLVQKKVDRDAETERSKMTVKEQEEHQKTKALSDRLKQADQDKTRAALDAVLLGGKK